MGRQQTINQAIIFFVVHQMVFGFYMGAVFAPNHKGMPPADEFSDLDFIRKQVLTTRNVFPNPIYDFLCGGLNYQIEHHLFPTMPRNVLKTARPIVREFCNKNGIKYNETSIFQSQRDVLRHLHEISSPLRNKNSKGSIPQKEARVG